MLRVLCTKNLLWYLQLRECVRSEKTSFLVFFFYWFQPMFKVVWVILQRVSILGLSRIEVSWINKSVRRKILERIVVQKKVTGKHDWFMRANARFMASIWWKMFRWMTYQNECHFLASKNVARFKFQKPLMKKRKTTRFKKNLIQEKLDRKAWFLLYKCIGPKVLHRISKAKTEKEIWEIMIKTYEDGDWTKKVKMQTLQK